MLRRSGLSVPLRWVWKAEADMDDRFTGCDWFAVVSHVGLAQYELAAKELERQRYRVLAPLCRKERRHAGKTETVTKPLFDRYLFAGVHPGQSFRPIVNTRGVAFVVRGLSGAPCRVPLAALRCIQDRCDADGGVVDFTPAKRKTRDVQWQKDQPVRIVAGPFTDFVGLFAGASKDVVRVVLDLFGRETPLALDAQNVVPVDPVMTQHAA
ncbi:hypothetical protein D3869_26770 (plasmid) [Azospirillum brasilense]|uniref:NusG-like N-terminal domain-containing protein n=2 Tax=Azospirillum brasilense TaxID=192 RepID=A0A4D8RBV1_AZOBR|nr:hypothetical protein D3869_26770 [Azospirillum brasilense]